jgi:FeS assembly SUF system regulator
MLRISKLTDYGIVLLAHCAAVERSHPLSAREMSEATHLPLPVVSKVLKTLAGADLLASQRGARGGYTLAREPQNVTVAQIIEALEGPIALMECSAGPGHCEQQSDCAVAEPWQRINRAIERTLEHVTLAELAHRTSPIPPSTLQIADPVGS